jgi:hypothetical protein
MINTRNLAISICGLVLWTPLIYAQDLSKYREFQLGMNLLAVMNSLGHSFQFRRFKWQSKSFRGHSPGRPF